jgi:3-dehydrosphinganine reductase
VATLNDAHAIVTGGSSGIGRSVARMLAERGARVSLVARGEERLHDAAESLRDAGHQVQVASTDVSDRDQVSSTIAHLTSTFGDCDVLVTSAGIVQPGHFTELGDDVHRRTMEVDYFGTLWPVRAVVPAMVARRSGSIVGISSGAGLTGVFGYSAYSPAKFAVRGLLEVLRCELAPHGVHVGCACPPDTDTPQLAYENRFKPAETRAISGAIKPLSADRVAASIIDGIDRRRFLITPDAASRVLARTVGLLPGTYFSLFDRRVRKSRQQAGQTG